MPDKIINVWINDKTAGKTLKSITVEAKKLRTEIATKLVRGTKDYEVAVKKLSGLNNVIKKHTADIRGVGTAWKRIKTNVGGFFKSQIGAIAGVTGAILLLKRGIQGLFDVTAKFEKTLTNVFTLLSEQELKEFGEDLEKGAIQVIKDYGLAIDDVNKALFNLVSAGIPAGQAIDVLNESAKLAVGGASDLTSAVTGTTKIMNAYNLEAGEAAKVTSALFIAQKRGVVTVQELSENIGTSTGFAKLADIGYQKLLATFSTLSKVTKNTEETFTIINAVIQSLTKVSPNLEKKFLDLGIETGITAIKTNGFMGTLKQLNKALKDDEDAVTELIPSIRGLKGVAALGTKEFEHYDETLRLMNENLGANSLLIQAVALQQETLSFKTDKAKQSWKALFLEFGVGESVFSSLIDILLKGIQLLSVFFSFIKDNISTIKVFARVLLTLVSGITSYKIAIAASNIVTKVALRLTAVYQLAMARLALATGRATFAQKRMIVTQRGLNLAMKANPIGLIVGLLATVATAFLLFRDRVKDATDEQNEFNKAVQEGIDVMKAVETLEDRFRILTTLNRRQTEEFLTNTNSQIDKLEDQRSKYDELIKSSAEFKEVERLRANEATSINEFLLIEAEKELAVVEKQILGNKKLSTSEIENSRQRLIQFKKEAEERLKILPRDIDPEEAEKTKKQLEKEIKEREKARKAEEAKVAADFKRQTDDVNKQAQQQRIQLKQSLEVGASTQKVFAEQSITIEKQRLEDLLKLFEEFQKNTGDIEEGIADNAIAEKKRITEAERERLQKEQDLKIAQLQLDLTTLEEGSKQKLEKQKELAIIELEFQLAKTEASEELKQLIRDRFIEEFKNKQSEADEEGLEGLKEDIVTAFRVLGDVVSGFADIRSAESRQRIQDIQSQSDKSLSALEKQLEQGKITVEEFDQFKEDLDNETADRVAKEQQKQAEKEKKLAIFKALVNTAIAVTKEIPNIPLMILAGLLGGLQVAKIKATPIPQAAKGGYTKVIGADDMKQYRAKISQGFKGGHIKEPTLLTGERGDEFVINNKSLQNPVIARTAEAIDHIQHTRQMQTGGFTGEIPEVDPSQQSDGTNQVANIEVIEQNNRIMERLIAKLDEPLKIIWTNDDTENIREEISDQETVEDNSRV